MVWRVWRVVYEVCLKVVLYERTEMNFGGTVYHARNGCA